MTTQSDPLIPLNRFTEQVEVHPVTLIRWVKRDGLPATKIGGQWFVRQSEFDQFINRNAVKAGA